MKKLICLILGMLIFTACFSGLADSTEVPFAQIREYTAANVYAKPGDEEPFDTLDSGRICGLLDETNEAGTVWFHIFYLDSQKQGRDGYIEAEKAEKLSKDALAALLEDPEKFNGILDLIDAVNDFLSLSDGSAAEQADPKAGKPKESSLKDFYDQAMQAVEEISSAIGSADLSAVTEAVEEIGRKVSEAGEDLLGQVRDRAQEVQQSLESVDLDSMVQDMQTKLEELKDKLENSGIGEELEGLRTQLEDALGDQGSNLQGKIQELQDRITELRETTDTNLVSVLEIVGAQFTELFGSK